MTGSKGELMWKAATENNVDTVCMLLQNGVSSSSDVNWTDPEHSRTPLYRACSHGFLEVASKLLSDPRVQVNKANVAGATPFFLACQQGHTDIVKLLLRDPRIDVLKPDSDFITPFFMVCARGNLDIVKLLLQDKRVDINAPTKTNTTALWFACQEGFLDIVEWILAAREVVHHLVKTVAGPNGWNGKTPREMAARRGHEEIVKLMERYEQAPEKVRFELRRKHKLLDAAAAEVFAITVLYCDKYLDFRPWLTSKMESNTVRFFLIVSQLPMDLQMTLANRLHQLPKEYIPLSQTELAFRMVVSRFQNKA